MIDSQNKLAKFVERSVATVSKHRSKNPGWPVKRQPPWTQAEADAIKRWFGSLNNPHVKATTAKLPKGSKSQVQVGVTSGQVTIHEEYKMEQTELTRAKRRLLLSQYIEKEIHNAALSSLTAAFIEALESLAKAIPLAIVDLSPEDAEDVIKSLIDDQRARLAEQGTVVIEVAEREASRKRNRVSDDGSEVILDDD